MWHGLWGNSPLLYIHTTGHRSSIGLLKAVDVDDESSARHIPRNGIGFTLRQAFFFVLLMYITFMCDLVYLNDILKALM